MRVVRELHIDIASLPIPLRLREVGKSKAAIPIENLSDEDLGRVGQEWTAKLIKQAKILRGQPREK